MDFPQHTPPPFAYEIISNTKHTKKENSTASCKNTYQVKKGIQKPSLILFVQEGCFYCDKVITYLKKIHKENSITFKDIKKDKDAYNKLIKIGGKKQVPCMFINGIPQYESDWIIQWLKENKDCY